MQKFRNYLICGLFLSLAWPIRGQFGDYKGAMIPGAFAATALSLLAIGNNWKDNFGKAVITGSLWFGLGGFMGYGKLIDQILASPTLLSQWKELLQVFFIGALWGTLGMTGLGFGYSEKGVSKKELVVMVLAFVAIFLILDVFDLGQYTIALLTIALAAMLLYNLLYKKSVIISIFGLTGLVSVGLGFLISVTLLWLGQHGYFGSGFDWWTLRDQMIGLAAGLGVAFAFQHCTGSNTLPLLALPDLTVQKIGFIFYVVFIPYLNLVMVYDYWYAQQKLFPLNTFLVLTAVSGVLFGLLAVYLSKLDSDAYHTYFIRTLSMCTFFFMWFLSILAIVKQVLPLGMSIWETAYTLFLIESALLSLFLIPRFFQSKTLRF